MSDIPHESSGQTANMFTSDETRRNADNTSSAYGLIAHKMHVSQPSVSPASAAAGHSDSSSTGSLSPPSRDNSLFNRTAATVMVPKSPSAKGSMHQQGMVAAGSLLPGPTPRHSIDAILGLPGRVSSKPALTQNNNIPSRGTHSDLMEPGFQGTKDLPCTANRLSDQDFARDQDAESDRDHDVLCVSGKSLRLYAEIHFRDSVKIKIYTINLIKNFKG